MDYGIGIRCEGPYFHSCFEDNVLQIFFRSIRELVENSGIQRTHEKFYYVIAIMRLSFR